MATHLAILLVIGSLAVPPGRTMTVVCGGAVRRTLTLLGAGDVATLRLVGVRGDV